LITRVQGPTHVLIVDSDRDLCRRLVGFLEEAGFRATAVHEGQSALPTARRLHPQLAVVEVVLPEVSGYEVCHAWRDEFGPLAPIILVSGDRPESYDRVAGLLIGADDYLVKPFSLDELLVRIRALVGRTSVSGRTDLTPREQEVLHLLAEGFDQNGIASSLVISPNTVATHIDHILAKLGVHSRAEAVAHAYREHLVTSDSRSRTTR
jgi:DNA-binding NarL/FixJ family response regulator